MSKLLALQLLQTAERHSDAWPTFSTYTVGMTC